MSLAAADLRALERAVGLLESPRLAIRVANYAGKPLESTLGAVPFISGAVHEVVRKAILNCLKVAIDSQEPERFAPSSWRARTLTGLAGGIGGLFGAFSLPVELPLTLTLMLRAIADIARHHGEDLSTLEARLACLQVFALGDRKSDAGVAIGYYAARATLTQLTADLVASLAQHTVVDATAPVMMRLVGEVTGRLGLVLSERSAAGAVPVLGALGGAALNVVFTDHFVRVAEGHFTIRRLERAHGAETIAELYRVAASKRR